MHAESKCNRRKKAHHEKIENESECVWTLDTKVMPFLSLLCDSFITFLGTIRSVRVSEFSKCDLWTKMNFVAFPGTIFAAWNCSIFNSFVHILHFISLTDALNRYAYTYYYYYYWPRRDAVRGHNRATLNNVYVSLITQELYSEYMIKKSSSGRTSCVGDRPLSFFTSYHAIRQNEKIASRG